MEEGDSLSLHSSSSFLIKDLVIEVLKKDVENRTQDDIGEFFQRILVPNCRVCGTRQNLLHIASLSSLIRFSLKFIASPLLNKLDLRIAFGSNGVCQVCVTFSISTTAEHIGLDLNPHSTLHTAITK